MSIASSLIDINGGAVVLTTRDQPIYMMNSTFKGWLYDPQDLLLGDSILDAATGKWVTVTSLTTPKLPMEVFDLRTNGLHDLIANGYLLLDKPALHGGGGPLVIETIASSTNLTEAGGTITFFALTSGGSNLNITYSWSFGDGSPVLVMSSGAVVVDANHTYRMAGIFAARLDVSDGHGSSDSAMLNVSVLPPLVAAINATPTSILVGQQVLLTATVSGGTGVYAATWLGLPAGCVSSNITTLTCTPTLAGTYLIHLMVVDSLNFGTQSAAHEFTVYLEKVNIVLTIAGTPGNSFNITVLDNGSLMACAQVTRTAGPPDRVSLQGLYLQVNHSYEVVVTMLPGAHGATPATLNISYQSHASGDAFIGHVFNAQHPGTWVWKVDLNAVYTGTRT